jgi:histidine triad (HIT) family protein
MDCVFCKIIKKELPCHLVYEDEHTIAFLDISPINEGHTLVIPKRHEEDFSKLSDTEAGKLFAVARRITLALKTAANSKELKCEGVNLFMSNGAVAGQEVMHSHLHITPRFEGDGQKLGFKRLSSNKPGQGRFKDLAEFIINRLN